ncbi:MULTISPECIES: hypothetical protein [unclassified Pseudofrankia]|uniref:hypothetical protein n=1 Tax=unclassified Pseudofrankia TaxID=2994372 RepID=UPI0008DAAB59|nr:MULTISPECIES: hypothetical protein [unclassified Pseudofrankia]MDT3441026.1 hypothetical protein [Pseudofrankia sp. BMG5.37]OHV42537.1 hypothetical protein BCD48_30830 [Pseudofrankia sp. BMG5.36]
MDVADLVLDYVRTLTWPLILVFALLWFRGPIAGLLGALGKLLSRSTKVSVTAGPVEAAIEARAEQAEAQLAAEVPVASDAVDVIAQVLRSEEGDTPISAAGRKVAAVDSIRLHELLAAAAELGWARGRLGDDGPPSIPASGP